MKKSLSLLVVVLQLVGCAYANAFTSKPSAQVDFDDAAVPAGTGWSCFDRNTGSDLGTICERTAEACDASKEREAGRGSAVSACRPADRAFCFYQDLDPSKAAVLIPLGDKEKVLGCFASLEECNDLRSNHAENSSTGGGVVAISACRELP